MPLSGVLPNSSYHCDPVVKFSHLRAPPEKFAFLRGHSEAEKSNGWRFFESTPLSLAETRTRVEIELFHDIQDRPTWTHRRTEVETIGASSRCFRLSYLASIELLIGTTNTFLMDELSKR